MLARLHPSAASGLTLEATDVDARSFCKFNRLVLLGTDLVTLSTVTPCALLLSGRCPADCIRIHLRGHARRLQSAGSCQPCLELPVLCPARMSFAVAAAGAAQQVLRSLRRRAWHALEAALHGGQRHLRCGEATEAGAQRAQLALERVKAGALFGGEREAALHDEPELI